MINSLCPKALLYKEWRQKRWIAILAFLLVAPSVYLNNIMPAVDGHRHITVKGYTMTGGHLVYGPSGRHYVGGISHLTSVQHVDVVALNFAQFCNGIVTRSTVGWWASLVFVALAAYSLWTERHRDSYWFTFAQPFSKAEVLRAKVVVDLSILLGVFTVFAISLGVIDASVSAHYPVLGIVRWWFAQIAIQGSMYGLGLVAAVLVTNPVASGLLAFGASWVPQYLGIFLMNEVNRRVNGALAGAVRKGGATAGRTAAGSGAAGGAVGTGGTAVGSGGVGHGAVNWALTGNGMVFDKAAGSYLPGPPAVLKSEAWTWIVSHLSPMGWLGQSLVSGWENPILFLLGFAVLAGGCVYMAVVFFERSQAERQSYVFPFAASGPWLGLLVCGVAAFLPVRWLANASMVREFVVMLVMGAVLWAFFLVARKKVKQLQ